MPLAGVLAGVVPLMSPEPPRSTVADFPSHAEFETPENVLIGYPLAGGGTRFLAWLVDQVFVWLTTIFLSLGLLLVGLAVGMIERGFLPMDPSDSEASPQSMSYFVGVMLLVFSFGSFLYFCGCEYFLRGTTPGKRLMDLRVVRANGFSLDPASLFLRNLFRFVDHLPPLWIVPVFSRRTQRIGDMVAGTLVVRDRADPLPRIRLELAGRPEEESRHRFDRRAVSRLTPMDIEFLERLLSRWKSIPPRQRQRLLQRSLPSLARRMETEMPPVVETVNYLKDLLAAEYRRRNAP